MTRSLLASLLCAVALFLLSVSVAQAQTQTISINFAADEPPGFGSEVEGPAGILGSFEWNNLTLNFGIEGDLVDSNGNLTDTSVLWESNNTWASAKVPTENGFEGRSEDNINEDVPANGDRYLMTGYLDSNDVGNFCLPEETNNPVLGGPNWCGANRVIVGGLSEYTEPYSVIVYLNGGITNRSGRYQLTDDQGDRTVFHHDVGPFDGVFDLSFENRDIDGQSELVYTGDVMIFSDVTGDLFTINTHADNLGGTTAGFRSLINGIEITGEVGPPPGLLCDHNGDLVCDILDLDMQMNEIGANVGVAADDGGPARGPSPFDLNNDGSINDFDRDEWLSIAATENGLSAPYQLGDTNLDLHVNVSDLNNLGLAWRSDSNNWSEGNLTGAGVDAADLNIIALGWQTSHPDAPVAAAVPEPAGIVLAVVALLLLVTRRR